MAAVTRENSLIDFDERLRIGTSALVGRVADLWPEERRYVENSVESRQVEFATGRLVARRLLRDLGHPDRAIERDADRVPVWPDGVVGSISHTDGACLAAVSEDSSLRGVGVDVEVDEPRSARFFERIATRRERESLGSDVAVESLATRFFSAKEAIYKACFPSVREFWGFHDVEAEIDLGTGRFLARVPASAPGTVEGRMIVFEGRVWTVVRWC